MYWFSAPAIIKGWIDRVLTKGFAYADEKGLVSVRLPVKLSFTSGLCSSLKTPISVQNKRVLISLTTGSQESMFRAQSIHGEFKFTFLPMLVHQWLKEIETLPDSLMLT